MRIPKLDSKNHVHHYFAFCISFYCNLKGKLLSTYTTYIYIYIYIYTHTHNHSSLYVTFVKTMM